ncbi:SET domain-containing protein [Candidatus Dependentiae bacterium]|nr:SET domain-containing protein [Candidatus Dependentiae bacterium]
MKQLLSLFSLATLFATTIQTIQYDSILSKSEDGKGQGLIATKDLKAGTLVQKFEGEETEREYKCCLERAVVVRHVKWIDRDENGKDKWILVTSDAAYLNHSCDANCKVVKGDVITIKDIKAGDELTISYNSRSLNNFPADMVWKKKWDLPCKCNAHNCQKLINKFVD